MVRVMHRVVSRGLKALIPTALPSLRVVALTYTGLGGVAALVLVVSVAVMPKQPIVQQVTEPALQAVTAFMPPSVELFGRTTAQAPTSPAAAPTAAPFMATVTIDVTIDDAEPTVEEPVAEPAPTVVPAPLLRRIFVPAPVKPTPAEAVVDEGQPDEVVEEPAPVEAIPTETAIVEPAAPVLRIATTEAPKALPSPPVSPQEAKARADAANQAAIGAAKAAQAEAKAEADVANQAAIDALKRAEAAGKNAPAMADAALEVPTPAPTRTPVQAAKAAADSSNQAAIDAAKAAQARAKAEADAANQAAIDAAKAAKTKKP